MMRKRSNTRQFPSPSRICCISSSSFSSSSTSIIPWPRCVLPKKSPAVSRKKTFLARKEDGKLLGESCAPRLIYGGFYCFIWSLSRSQSLLLHFLSRAILSVSCSFSGIWPEAKPRNRKYFFSYLSLSLSLSLVLNNVQSWSKWFSRATTHTVTETKHCNERKKPFRPIYSCFFLHFSLEYAKQCRKLERERERETQPHGM